MKHALKLISVCALLFTALAFTSCDNGNQRTTTAVYCWLPISTNTEERYNWPVNKRRLYYRYLFFLQKDKSCFS